MYPVPMASAITLMPVTESFISLRACCELPVFLSCRTSAGLRLMRAVEALGDVVHLAAEVL